MKTHTVWVVITVSYFIFTSAAVHTRSNQPFLSVKPQTSNVARSLTPHAQVAAGHAHGDAHEADQAGCARTTDATVFGAVGARPQRQRRARPASGVPFVTPRDRAGPDRYPAPPAGSRAVGVRGIRAIRSLQSAPKP